jgi:hypothetical protein
MSDSTILDPHGSYGRNNYHHIREIPHWTLMTEKGDESNDYFCIMGRSCKKEPRLLDVLRRKGVRAWTTLHDDYHARTLPGRADPLHRSDSWHDHEQLMSCSPLRTTPSAQLFIIHFDFEIQTVKAGEPQSTLQVYGRCHCNQSVQLVRYTPYSLERSDANPTSSAQGPQRTNMFIKIYITITNQWLYLTHRSQCTGLCCVRGIPRICLRVIVMEDLVP